MRVIGESLVLVAALVIAGGAGAVRPSASPPPPAAAPASPASPAGEPATAGSASTSTDHLLVHRTCRSAVRKLDAQLGVLDERLAIGMDLDGYAARVGPANFSYATVLREAAAGGAVGDRCTRTVLAPLGSALRAYVSTYEAWTRCVSQARCTLDRPPARQSRDSWSEAHVLLARADASLSDLCRRQAGPARHG